MSSRTRGEIAAELDALLGESPARVQRQERAAFDEAAANAEGIVLYGAGGMGRALLQVLRSNGIEPLCFADAAPRHVGTQVESVPVLHPEEAGRRFGSKALFIVAVYNAACSFRDIRSYLRNIGCQHVISFLPLAWKYSDALLPRYAAGLPHRALRHSAEIRAAFALLEDDSSRQEFADQVRWRLTGDYERLQSPSSADQYFDPQVLRLLPSEVFVDCGAYDGDTLRAFFRHASDRFLEAILIEPDPISFARLRSVTNDLPEGTRRRIRAFNFALGREPGTVSFAATGLPSAKISEGSAEVCRETLATILQATRPPTYIKMDIEGAELDALEGAADLISRSRPALAICLYHLPEHLWQIPLRLAALCDKYKYYVRRYGADVLESVLYAVPEERWLKAA